jgi:uncharacterized membrane protein
MPSIDSTIVIRASMPRVFDLISRPQLFAECSQYIAQIVPFGKNKYHWEVDAAGITLGWDSVTTEYRRPEHLAWRSITGIENSGSYTLAQTKRGTLLTLEMDYHLPSRMLDAVAAPLSEPLVQAAIMEVLENIKGRLENETDPDA